MQVVYTNQLGGGDDGALQEAALRQRAAKSVVELGGSPLPPLDASQEASLAAKTAASGQINDLLFLDLDTCFWQIAHQRWIQDSAYDATSIPSMSRVRGVEGRRWLVAACENKLTLHDLASSESLDLSRSAAFDSKAPTRLAMLCMNSASLTGASTAGASTATAHLSPVLAVGVSSGSIYVVSPTSSTVFAKLTGGHRSTITALLPFGGDGVSAPDRLLSASSDGTIAIWDPSRTPKRGGDREMGPLRTFKAHDAGVKAAAFFVAYHPEKPDKLPLRLATVGDDKKVTLWDASGNWAVIDRLQPPPKTTYHSVGFAPWGGAGLGVQPSLIAASGDVPIVWGINPTTKEFLPLINLQGMIDPGQKKVPKVYNIAVHPTRPHLSAAATNTGVVLLSADASEKPAVVALPSQVVTLEALMQKAANAKVEGQGQGQAGGGGRGAQGFTYVMAVGGKLWSTALRLESRSKEGASERTVSLEAGPREAIASLEHPGRPLLACSATGRSISAVWPETRTYAIFSLAPSGSWEVIDKGSGNCIAWASTAPMYALISVPNIPTAAPKAKRGFLGKMLGNRKAEEEAEEEAVAAAARAAAAATTVQVHVVDEENASQFVAAHDVQLSGAQPVVLHGGALLGVVAIDPVSLKRALRFFSWRDFSPVGPALPEPQWVSWEPDCTLAALAYEHTIELCRVQPAFQRFATLALPHAAASIWQSRQLFVSTPTSLHLIFADPAQEFVQEVTLASFQGGVASKTAPSVDATPLPPEQMRPAGPVTLAGVRHSYLWLADAFGRPFLVPLRHPGLRLRCLAARGELTTARTIAERGLSPAFHDDVARFLAAMSPGDGVKEGLLLPGLTSQTEMVLSIRDGAWDRAAQCFQAFALGVSHRGVLALAGGANGRGESVGDVVDRLGGVSLGQERLATVASILKEHEFRSAQGDLEEGETADDEEAANENQATKSSEDEDDEAGSAGEAEEEGGEESKPQPDPVEWDAPLQRPFDAQNGDDEGTAVARAGAEMAAANAASKVIDPGELRRITAAAKLGLRFAAAAADSGHMDAARSALGVLVRFAPVLPPAVLEELTAWLGRCRMSESARNLAAAAAAARPGSALQDPSVATLLAALAGGAGGDAVQGTLHAAGLMPLAAMYAAVWGQGDVDTEVTKWKGQLGGRLGNVRVSPPRV